MSIYTESASRPGVKGTATADDRALFLREFGGYVITSYDGAIGQYNDLRWIKNITQGKSDTFPIIGRKRDAAEHEPGELIVGGKIENNEIEISLDKMIFDSVFLPEIDELMNHIDVAAQYAHQLGQSLGELQATRIARMHILAGRFYDVAGVPTNVPNGQPAPGYYFHANLKTDATKIEEFAFQGRQYILENDISGDMPKMMLPWAQYLLFARSFGVSDFKEAAGGGSKVTGTVGKVANIGIEGTNFMPKSNVTTGNPKYQGNFSTTVGHISTAKAVGSLERRGVRLTRKDQEERLGTLMIASQFNGHGVLRPEMAYEGRTNARS